MVSGPGDPARLGACRVGRGSLRFLTRQRRRERRVRFRPDEQPLGSIELAVIESASRGGDLLLCEREMDRCLRGALCATFLCLSNGGFRRADASAGREGEPQATVTASTAMSHEPRCLIAAQSCIRRA